jgi:[acyl-carrier-protein] S-malonyltransferase
MSNLEATTAFLFPGQGELQVGIGRDIYDNSRAAKAVFDLDGGLRDLCFNGPHDRLNDPYNNQAANFLVWMAICAALGEIGIRPAGLAGQSLGEYAALSYAGAFTVKDAIPMLQQRARIMTDRIPTGSGMRAILGLETPTVEQFCAESSSDDEPCQIAIYSTHDRNVITGTLTAIEQCAQRCSESGAKVMPVRVARAFHSSLGRTAREEFGQVLETFAIDQPRLNVYYNYDGTHECDDIGAMLAGQLVKPVHLVETINSLLGDGYRQFIKIGPGGFFGDAVQSIARDQDVEVRVFAVESFADIGRIATRGVGGAGA